MKIVFLQNKGKSYGGVCQVNKIVGEALIKDGYEVSIISIRENHNDYKDNYDPKLHVETLNTKDDWETYNYSEVISDLKKFHLITALKKLKHRLHNNKTLKEDAIKLKEMMAKADDDHLELDKAMLMVIILDLLKPVMRGEEMWADIMGAVEDEAVIFDAGEYAENPYYKNIKL